MGVWSFQCNACGAREIDKKIMSRDRCRTCGIGRYHKLEHLPDEYLNELKGRSYRNKLHALQQLLANGRITRQQFNEGKEWLDTHLPNPKVDWSRIPKSFKTIHEIDDYEDEPDMKIIVPEIVPMPLDQIAVGMREHIVKPGDPNFNKPKAKIKLRSKK